jgi:hypothetical protein
LFLYINSRMYLVSEIFPKDFTDVGLRLFSLKLSSHLSSLCSIYKFDQHIIFINYKTEIVY